VVERARNTCVAAWRPTATRARGYSNSGGTRTSIDRTTHWQEEDSGGSSWQRVVGEAAASAQQGYPSTVSGGGGGGALVGSAGELHGSLL
jgi:hypothetical protein